MANYICNNQNGNYNSTYDCAAVGCDTCDGTNISAQNCTTGNCSCGCQNGCGSCGVCGNTVSGCNNCNGCSGCSSCNGCNNCGCNNGNVGSAFNISNAQNGCSLCSSCGCDNSSAYMLLVFLAIILLLPTII